MYEIILADEAKKQLSSLNTGARERIGLAFERIKVRPHKFTKRLYGSKYYRLRVDNYRIILVILDTQLIIYVIEIGYRESIYNKF